MLLLPLLLLHSRTTRMNFRRSLFMLFVGTLHNGKCATHKRVVNKKSIRTHKSELFRWPQTYKAGDEKSAHVLCGERMFFRDIQINRAERLGAVEKQHKSIYFNQFVKHLCIAVLPFVSRYRFLMFLFSSFRSHFVVDVVRC
jgi:hypothetical protein